MDDSPGKVLSIHRRGSVDFPRWIVSDQFLRYWTGCSWSEVGDESSAIVFCAANDACKQIQELLLADYGDRPVRHFRAPIYVDLWSDREVSRQELLEWLFRVARLLIESPRFGNGPVEGSLGLVRIDWDRLEQLEA